MKVSDIYSYIDSFAPFASQAAWDNSGILLGSGDAEVQKVLVCLDVTKAAAAFAAANGCGLIVSHHPVIFHAVKRISPVSAVWDLIRNDVCVLSAHTNLDKAPGGVNDTLCEALGLEYTKCPPEVADGFLNVGTLSENNIKAGRLAQYIAACLHTEVRFADAGMPISRIAVCAGAGGDLASDALRLGCGALITGEASHHDFLDAAAMGISLFAAGHFETEVPVVERLQKKLSGGFPDGTFFAFSQEAPIKILRAGDL